MSKADRGPHFALYAEWRRHASECADCLTVDQQLDALTARLTGKIRDARPYEVTARPCPVGAALVEALGGLDDKRIGAA